MTKNLCTDRKQITYDFILKFFLKKIIGPIISIKLNLSSLEFPKIRDNLHFPFFITISKNKTKLSSGFGRLMTFTIQKKKYIYHTFSVRIWWRFAAFQLTLVICLFKQVNQWQSRKCQNSLLKHIQRQNIDKCDFLGVIRFIAWPFIEQKKKRWKNPVHFLEHKEQLVFLLIWSTIGKFSEIKWFKSRRIFFFRLSFKGFLQIEYALVFLYRPVIISSIRENKMNVQKWYHYK